MAEQARDLTAALATDLAPGRAGALAASQKKLIEEAQRLAEERARLQADVHGYEQTRDECVERSFWFEIGFV